MIRRLLRRSAKQAKPAASLDRERLSSLINSMADGVIAVDGAMKIVVANGEAQNILDVNATLTGQRLGEVFRPIDANRQPVDIEGRVQATKTPAVDRDLRLIYSDDSICNLYVSIAPVHYGYGQPGQRGYVLVLRDITREKSLEEERDEFISVVSHELRTPIAVTEGNVSNALYMAEHSNASEDIQTALKQAHAQVLFLADMVNDLSMLSRAERGKLVVEPTPINIPEFCNALVNVFREEAAQKGLTLDVELADKAQVLSSSELYVKEILQNFLANAVKYTDKGHVRLTAKPHKKGTLFTVSDTGIGISKRDQEQIFDKFFRSEDFRTRKHSGTGLGLYVTTKLARLLNAELDVESTLNKGSTFSLYVPDTALRS